jgi:outer membrane receptor protein involved in Fe transport
VTYTSGRHNLRIGAAVERMRDNMFATSNPNGVFTFNSLQDFIRNQPYTFAVSIPGTPSPRDLRQTLFAVYAQDDVRFTPRLTWNLGLRYETISVPTETGNKLSAL